MIEQVIEETALFKAGVSFTLSFYVRSSVALTSVPVRVWGVVTGSGSSVISETYSTTTDWVRKTFTGTAPVDLLEDIRVSPIPAYDLSTGQWMEFANVQLELGSVATDFEHRSYGEELALCQRYYQKSRNPDKFSGDSDRGGEVSFRGYTSTGASSFQWYQFPVTMRSAPTITIEGTGPDDISASLIGTNGFRACYATDNYHYNFYYYADAEL